MFDDACKRLKTNNLWTVRRGLIAFCEIDEVLFRRLFGGVLVLGLKQLSGATIYRVDRSLPSVITSKAAINDHFKTGQRNRGQDMKLFYRAGGSLGKLFLILLLLSLPTSGRA